MEELQEEIVSGEKLKAEILSTHDTRESLIESLIPKLSITQFYAPDGIGKSTLVTQLACEASSGQVVFGGFQCSKPLRIIYIPTERPKVETYERIKLMMNHIQINFDNLAVQEMLGYDLLNNESRAEFLGKIVKFDKVFGPDLFIFDPIYSLISRDIDKSTVGPINTALLLIQMKTKKAISYTHHANRGQRNKDTGERQAEDMYGGRFLSAKCTGVFKVSHSEHGTIIKMEKDSYRCLAHEINLNFDEETYLSTMMLNQSSQSSRERMNAFIDHCLKISKTFTFAEILSEARVSTSLIREYLGGEVKKGKIINLKPIGSKALYKVVSEEKKV